MKTYRFTIFILGDLYIISNGSIDKIYEQNR